MKHKFVTRWLPTVLLFISWTIYGGCGRDAFVVVHVDGASDQRIRRLVLTANISGVSSSWQAEEDYGGHPAEVSFFLPDGSLGGIVNVEVAAWDSTYILATGKASGSIENRPRLDLSVRLLPVGS